MRRQEAELNSAATRSDARVDGYRLVRSSAGTPQGRVINPLLANIYLVRLDQVLDAEGVSYVRYADDVRLTSRTEAERSTR